MNTNEIPGEIIDAAIKIHRQRGPGLLIIFHVPLLKDGIKRMAN